MTLINTVELTGPHQLVRRNLRNLLAMLKKEGVATNDPSKLYWMMQVSDTNRKHSTVRLAYSQPAFEEDGNNVGYIPPRDLAKKFEKEVFSSRDMRCRNVYMREWKWYFEIDGWDRRAYFFEEIGVSYQPVVFSDGEIWGGSDYVSIIK